MGSKGININNRLKIRHLTSTNQMFINKDNLTNNNKFITNQSH
jgi:hypothetical protein